MRSLLRKEDYEGTRIPTISSDVSFIPMYHAEQAVHALSFSSTWSELNARLNNLQGGSRVLRKQKTKRDAKDGTCSGWDALGVLGSLFARKIFHKLSSGLCKTKVNFSVRLNKHHNMKICEGLEA
jgi:hypothetical protein